MKRICEGLALAAVGGWTLMAPASAAPPTATPWPGYDARLHERWAAQTYYEPVERHPAPVLRRHVRRTHHDAH
jgi:hypothetical protein